LQENNINDDVSIKHPNIIFAVLIFGEIYLFFINAIIHFVFRILSKISMQVKYQGLF
jgi:hypothetical protein